MLGRKKQKMPHPRINWRRSWWVCSWIIHKAAELNLNLNFKNASFRHFSPVNGGSFRPGHAHDRHRHESLAGSRACCPEKKIKTCASSMPFRALFTSQSTENSECFLRLSHWMNIRSMKKSSTTRTSHKWTQTLPKLEPIQCISALKTTTVLWQDTEAEKWPRNHRKTAKNGKESC